MDDSNTVETQSQTLSEVSASTVDVLAEFREAVQAEKARIPAFKDDFIAVLKAAGITSLTVEYSGCGDSGQIDEVTSQPDEATGPLEAFLIGGESFDSIDEAAERLTEMLISGYHDGYENNEGGEGKVILDVVAGTLTYEHSDFYIETDTSTMAI